MDPIILVLLILFIGLPVLSLAVLAAFAATADYEPLGVDVRGGSLRGALASAAAKILVGDTKTFQLPLEVTLQKVGIFGASTPLVGGATVRDIEWRIYVDGEHVSTVTEASSVRVASTERLLRLPVNAEVHLPRGIIGSWRKYRADRRSGREVVIEVRGHVLVKHWLMTREMPVRVSRRVVVGDAVPRAAVSWAPVGTEPANVAEMTVRLTNPYKEEVLDDTLHIELLAHRRLRRDPVLGSFEERLRLDAGDEAVRRFRVRLEPSVREAALAQEVEEHEVWPRVQWGDDTLNDDDEGPVVRMQAADPGKDRRTVAVLEPRGHREQP